MRILRAISDLPWWTGLPIFLLGNVLIPFGVWGFITGFIICLVGSWIFSKLLKYNEEDSDDSYAIIGIPLFAALMFFTTQSFIAMNYDTLYGIRTVLGLFFGLNTFKGFRK